MPRKLVSPGEDVPTRKSGLSSLLNPRDLEETLSSVYVVGGAAITCNLLLWTILTVTAVRLVKFRFRGGHSHLVLLERELILVRF